MKPWFQFLQSHLVTFRTHTEEVGKRKQRMGDKQEEQMEMNPLKIKNPLKIPDLLERARSF